MTATTAYEWRTWQAGDEIFHGLLPQGESDNWSLRRAAYLYWAPSLGLWRVSIWTGPVSARYSTKTAEGGKRWVERQLAREGWQGAIANRRPVAA